MAYFTGLMRRLVHPLLLENIEHYRAQDVRRFLDPHSDASDRDRQAVVSIAGRPGVWLEHVSSSQERELGDFAERLPTIVFRYASGESLEETQRRLGGWSTWRLERALDAACGCIAAELNGRRTADGSIPVRG